MTLGEGVKLGIMTLAPRTCTVRLSGIPRELRCVHNFHEQYLRETKVLAPGCDRLDDL